MKKLTILLVYVSLLLGAVACGAQTSPSDQIMAELSSSELIPVQKVESNLYGFINKSGDYVIEPKFTFATFFLDGLALASDTTGRGGYVDAKGNWVIEPKYVSATMFHEGLAIVALPDSDLMAIDKNGNVKFRLPEVTRASLPMGGYIFCVKSDGSEALMNAKGEFVNIPGQFSDLNVLADNYVCLKDKDSKLSVGRIKDNSFVAVDLTVNYNIVDFSPEAGVYVVSVDDKYGLVDTKGKVICNPLYDYIEYDSKDMFVFKDSKDKYGWLNSKGDEVIPAKYKAVRSKFANRDFTAVSVSGTKYALIDRKGETLIPAKYDMIIVGFSKDKVIVKKGDEGLGLVSIDGEVLCKPQFKNMANVTDEIFMASVDDKTWGVIDDKGIFTGPVDLSDTPGGRNMIFYAESNLFDPEIIQSEVAKLIDKISYNENVPALAQSFNASKYGFLVGTTHCRLQSKIFSNLGVHETLYVDLNASAVVKPSYSGNKLEFNKNARPISFTITLEFDSQKKCNETFEYFAKKNGQTVEGNPSTPIFSIDIRPDKSYYIYEGSAMVITED